MIIFCGSQAQILAQKTRFPPKISSDIRAAAGDLFTGPSQSLAEMSYGHWGTLMVNTVFVFSARNQLHDLFVSEVDF